MTKQPAVYILASKRNGTLYIGVTSDLKSGTWEHKNECDRGASLRNTKCTNWFITNYTAICCLLCTREKQMKKWNRA